MFTKTNLLLTLSLAALALPACDAPPPSQQHATTARAQGPIHYIGSDSDWFNPENWEGGVVPGRAGEDIVIGGPGYAPEVLLDPSMAPPDPMFDPALVTLGNIHLAGGARLETHAGTQLTFDELSAHNNSTYFAFASEWHGATLMLGTKDCSRWRCGYNPSALDADAVALTEDGALSLYLGGTLPAGPDAVGPGYHATVRGDAIALAGELVVGLRYGFTPTTGDRFVVIEAREQLKGEFSNAGDGDELARFGDVALLLTYEEKQVVLTAVAAS
ncbi:MAG: hypothetical protein H6713_42065 [Myxococcales bacterium]|nr:hypothetical protein [Myxococcales bacterium]